MRRDRRKCFGGEPHAVLHGIHVGEEAQDAVAVSRAGGESVNVAKIVAGVQACSAAAFFDGAIAGVIELPFAGVGGKQFAEEFCGGVRVVAKNGAKLLGFGGFGFIETGDAVFGGAVGDVFVVGGAGLLLAEKDFAFGGGNLKRSVREKEDVAGFELRAEAVASFAWMVRKLRRKAAFGVLHREKAGCPGAGLRFGRLGCGRAHVGVQKRIASRDDGDKLGDLGERFEND